MEVSMNRTRSPLVRRAWAHPVLGLLLLLGGCSGLMHTDAITVEVQQKTGNRSFTPGEPRTLVVSVAGGGGRTVTSFYRGPVTVTFDPPAGMTVEPNPVVVDMKPVNNYDRSRSSAEVTLNVGREVAAGDIVLPLVARTDRDTRAEATFRLQVSGGEPTRPRRQP